MFDMKNVIGVKVSDDIMQCKKCGIPYLVRSGWSSLRRHFKKQHPIEFEGLLELKENLEEFSKDEMEKEIKEERAATPDDDEFDFAQQRGASDFVPISPSHPDLQIDNIPEQMDTNAPTLASAMAAAAAGKKTSTAPQPIVGNAEMKPWYPSAKGRSIVWDHITWIADTQRAACNYCQADFQIKGGTSALLRHLKTVHPAAINFDPENPPPVVRRKAKKKTEDFAVVNVDTKIYMDNLLETFLHDENVPREEEAAPQMPGQSRADSEIDEVIRTLQKETAQMNGDEPDQDPDIRRILGIEEQSIPEELLVGGGAEEPLDPHTQNPDEEKQVSSSSGQNARKRRNDDVRMGEASGSGIGSGIGYQETSFKPKKSNPGYAASTRRPPFIGHPVPLLPPAASMPIPTTSSSSSTSCISARYTADAVHLLDIEAKVLYNQSLQSTIRKNDAEAAYLRVMTLKAELEVKRMERELGEETRSTTSDDPEHDPELEQEPEQEHEE